jgi:N-carbamoylputrescine amidase
MGLPIGLVQMRCADDPGENLERALGRVRFALAEPVPGPTTEALSKLAQARGVTLIASLFERRAEGIYHNTAVVIDRQGQILGRYRKMHIPDDPLYYEKFYFAPGDLGFRSFQTREVHLGVLVCWDQWFPEAARLTALAGAQILFYPTAIGWQFDEGAEVEAAQHDAWETVQRAHAIANGVFVAAVNRVGKEGEIRFWGRSFAADPFGRVLARASATEEETLLVDCDLALVGQARREWPFLRDRRIDAYADLGKRFRD